MIEYLLIGQFFSFVYIILKTSDTDIRIYVILLMIWPVVLAACLFIALVWAKYLILKLKT